MQSPKRLPSSRDIRPQPSPNASTSSGRDSRAETSTGRLENVDFKDKSTSEEPEDEVFSSCRQSFIQKVPHRSLATQSTVISANNFARVPIVRKVAKKSTTYRESSRPDKRDARGGKVTETQASESSSKSAQVRSFRGWTSKGVKARKSYIDSWEEYLKEKNVEAAPDKAFKQFIPPSASNSFQVGVVLGLTDEANYGKYFLARVVAKKGYRIKVAHLFTRGTTTQWFCIDSAELKALEECDLRPELFSLPREMDRDILTFPTVLKNQLEKLKGDGQSQLANPSWFGRPPPSPDRNYFRVGHKLEAIDIRNPALLCPATIKKILPDGQMVKVAFDGFSSSLDQIVSFKDRNLFPVYWHEMTDDALESSGPLPEHG